MYKAEEGEHATISVRNSGSVRLWLNAHEVFHWEGDIVLLIKIVMYNLPQNCMYIALELLFPPPNLCAYA